MVMKMNKMETTANGMGQVFFKNGKDQFTVTLHRTLRLPEDGKDHALPPSLGGFPIELVDDYRDKVPKSWGDHGGIFFPMWQREAMWLAFSSGYRPMVVKVAAGKINAVSGKEWVTELAPSDDSGKGDPRQDYLVAPPQPWLDGFNTGDGIIKQFVAMPLGMGYTVEGQVTGKEDHGGLQIMVVPPKAGLLVPQRRKGGILRSQSVKIGEAHDGASSMDFMDQEMNCGGPIAAAGEATNYSSSEINMVDSDDASSDSRGIRSRRRRLSKAAEMGLAAGGKMKQKLYPDPHGIDTWDVETQGRMFIHIVNSEMYEQITGKKPPKSPIDAQTYTQHGYPWFDVWDEGMGDVSASGTLGGVKSISEKDKEHGFEGQQDDSTVEEKNVVKQPILTGSGQQVRDGKW